MIIDRLENWKSYTSGAAWEKTFEFLMSLTPAIQEGEYPLQGDEIFARIMSYTTRVPGEAILEAHRKYIDIHTVLTGEERIEWFPVNALPVNMPYDLSKDAEFYNRPYPGPAIVDVHPGIFVTLFPQDAHMPSLMINNTPKLIKKVVIKLKVDLLKAT